MRYYRAESGDKLISKPRLLWHQSSREICIKPLLSKEEPASSCETRTVSRHQFLNMPGRLISDRKYLELRTTVISISQWRVDLINYFATTVTDVKFLLKRKVCEIKGWDLNAININLSVIRIKMRFKSEGIQEHYRTISESPLREDRCELIDVVLFSGRQTKV